MKVLVRGGGQEQVVVKVLVSDGAPSPGVVMVRHGVPWHVVVMVLLVHMVMMC